MATKKAFFLAHPVYVITQNGADVSNQYLDFFLCTDYQCVDTVNKYKDTDNQLLFFCEEAFCGKRPSSRRNRMPVHN